MGTCRVDRRLNTEKARSTNQQKAMADGRYNPKDLTKLTRTIPIHDTRIHSFIRHGEPSDRLTLQRHQKPLVSRADQCKLKVQNMHSKRQDEKWRAEQSQNQNQNQNGTDQNNNTRARSGQIRPDRQVLSSSRICPYWGWFVYNPKTGTNNIQNSLFRQKNTPISTTKRYKFSPNVATKSKSEEQEKKKKKKKGGKILNCKLWKMTKTNAFICV